VRTTNLGTNSKSWVRAGWHAVSITEDVQMLVATLKRQSTGDRAPGICAPLRLICLTLLITPSRQNRWSVKFSKRRDARLYVWKRSKRSMKHIWKAVPESHIQHFNELPCKVWNRRIFYAVKQRPFSIYAFTLVRIFQSLRRKETHRMKELARNGRANFQVLFRRMKNYEKYRGWFFKMK